MSLQEVMPINERHQQEGNLQNVIAKLSAAIQTRRMRRSLKSALLSLRNLILRVNQIINIILEISQKDTSQNDQLSHFNSVSAATND